MADLRPGHRLVAATLAAALMPLNSTMIAVALPDISQEFGQDPAIVTQALVTSYLVAAIVLQSPAGKIGDRIGHVRMLAIGQALVGLGSVIGFLAPSLVPLTAGRILMAAGGAVLIPATVALLRHGLPPERRGRAFGAFGAVMALAAAMGPLVGGELVQLFGWPSVFLANLPVLVVSVVVGALAGPIATGAAPAPAPFDWIGSGLLAAALTALVLGLRPGGDHALPLVAAGAVLWVPFVLRERRAQDPVIDFALFRSVPFSAGTALIAVQNLVSYALVFEIPLIADAVLGLEARQTGQVLVALMVAMVLVSPVAGRLVDVVGPRVMAVAGSAVAIAGIIDLARIDLTSPGRLAVPLALLGAGLGLATPAAQSVSISAVPADRAGMAAGITSTMRYLGGLVGVAVLSLLLDVSDSREAIISEHRALMGVFAGALVIGLVCAVVLPGRAAGLAPALAPGVKPPQPPGSGGSRRPGPAG